MKTGKHKQANRRHPASQARLSKAELDRLVEEAIVDCYSESEQAAGLYTMIEDHLQVPFETEVLGVHVTVTGIDITEDDQIVASTWQLMALLMKMRHTCGPIHWNEASLHEPYRGARNR